MRRHQRPSRPLLLALAAVLSAFSCGQNPPKPRQNGPQPPHLRDIPLSQSKIRVIKGVELKNLPGEAGKWGREEAARYERARQLQRWVQPVDKKFGEKPVGAKLIGEFALENATDKDHVIKSVLSSCACQKTVIQVGKKRYEIKKSGLKEPIPVPAGAKGKVEAHIEVPDRQGRVYTEVRLELSDPEVPFVRITAVVIAVREFIVEHEGQRRDTVDLGPLTVHSQRKFQFTVRSRDEKGFQVKAPLLVPDGMKIQSRPANAQKSVWTVDGQVGPGLSENSVGGKIQFKTDRKDGFAVNVFMLVRPPIQMNPSMLSFGQVLSRTGATQEVHLVCTDPRDSFEVAEVKIADLSIAGADVRAKVLRQDGRLAVIQVHIPPKQPKGRLHGKLGIRFKEDRYPARELVFLGFIR